MSKIENLVSDFYTQDVENFQSWRKKNTYFYDEILKFHKFLISPGKTIIEIGAGTGELLAGLEGSKAVAVDASTTMTSSINRQYSQIETVNARAENVQSMKKLAGRGFDYVIANGLLSQVSDVQLVLRGLGEICDPQTRLIVSTYNAFWEPILSLGAKLKMRSTSPNQNWLSDTDMTNLFFLEDFEIVSSYKRMLIPKYIPGISWFFNKILIHLPILKSMTLMRYYILRKRPVKSEPLSVSIVIPARNEMGNIEAAVKRLPRFGVHQQIIFVEGNSTDDTWREIQRVKLSHQDKDILILQQPGKGKGDAVRHGFKHASGDVLFILDADLTVPPEDLPKFHEAIESGKGEFVNGTRLVYPMEKEAMRFLNLLGNKFFAWAFSWLLSQKFRDTLCGTKVLKRKHYNMIAENRSYFGDFDPFGDFDLLFGAAKQNLKIVEVPIRYRERTYGETNISRFTHGWLLLKMCAYAAKKIKFI